MMRMSPGLVSLSDQLSSFVDQGRPVVVASPDLSLSTGLSKFQAQHPKRFLQMGISEQNTVSVAAGLSTTGIEPYVVGFASFLALLCCEQIRTDVAYTRLPVRLIGTHAGIAFGFYGTSHHATEDLAIMRSIANLTVIAPADARQLSQALQAYADHPLPVYLRIGRGREPMVYADDDDRFVPGRAIVHSAGRDLTLIATGTMVHPTLGAARRLREKGLDVGVIDMHTVKPIDEQAILTAAGSSRQLMTIEEHSVLGGLGGAVAEVLSAQTGVAPLHRHGIGDHYSVVGPPTHLYRHYHLDEAGIASVALGVMSAAEVSDAV